MSGGNSPRPLFRELATRELDWKQVSVFQVDERFVPAGDVGRNMRAIAEELVERGPVPRTNLLAMPVERPDSHRAAAEYETALQSALGTPAVLDVVHLGLGTDGHTASLFPGDPALDESVHDVAATALQAGFRRMTLTLPALNRARRVLWFATGVEKAATLAALAGGTLAAPAGQVERSRAVVVTDCTGLTLESRTRR